jgi:tetratricopeptide (TPR) repeat protein/TolB-like protein
LLLSFLAAPASAQEKAPPLRRIAIMPLVNLKPDKDTDWLGKGTAETLTTNLMKVSSLILVEQTQLAAVLYQQDRQIADFADPKTAVKVGKIVGAERVLIGSYAREGQSILFNVRMVDVETGIVLQAASVQGDWTKIFDLMTQLATAVIDSFDKKAVIVENRPVAGEAPKAERIVLTGEQAKRLKEWGTTNRDAYEAASRGCSTNNPDDKLYWHTKAIEFDPKYALAYYYRGSAYISKGEFEKAIADTSKAIELAPKFAEAYNNRGNAYSEHGEFDKAIKDLDKSIELDPKGAKTYDNRGIAYQAKGDSEKAIKDYGKAIELDPKFATAYNNRGTAYSNKREFDKAIKDYDKAIELDPKNATAYYNRGGDYFEIGQYDKAIKDCDKAIELDPKEATSYSRRGGAYAIKGDYERAIKDYSKAIELDPRLALAYENRGIVYYKKLQYDKAWEDVRACQRLGGTVDAKFLENLRKAAAQPPESQIDANHLTFQNLQRMVASINFDNTEFKAAIEWFQEVAKLNIQVKWTVLETAGVSNTSLVKSVHLKDVTVEKTLRSVLDDISKTTPLSYVVDDGAIIISTKDDLRKGATRTASSSPGRP